MSSLLTEYCKRHRNLGIVLPTQDGLCFFNDHKRPATVCLTSTYPRSYTTCIRCSQNDSVIVELFEPNREDAFTHLGHHHVQPDYDIARFVGGQTPVFIKNYGDIELWLWHFFLFHNRLRYSRVWKAWTDTQTIESEPLRTREQMAQCAIRHQRIFNVYYNMYQTFTVGRNYLLYE